MPQILQGRLAGPGRQPVPHVRDRDAAGGAAGHPDGSHPEPQPHRRRDGPDPLHRRGRPWATCPDSVFDPTRTLSYGSYDMAVGDRLAMMVPHNQYGMVVTLVLLILILNAMAIVLRSRVFRKLRGQ